MVNILICILEPPLVSTGVPLILGTLYPDLIIAILEDLILRAWEPLEDVIVVDNLFNCILGFQGVTNGPWYPTPLFPPKF